MTLLDLITRLQAAYWERIAGNSTYEQMVWSVKEAVRQWLAMN